MNEIVIFCFFFLLFVIRHLAKEIQCFTLFATHFHEITDLANTVPTVKNYHMEAMSDNDTFTLLYKVAPGVMDKSFGIHVAKLANFPENVLQMAQKIFDESEDHYAQLKSQKDEAAVKIYSDAIERLTSINPEKTGEDDIMKVIAEIQKSVQKSGNSYFKETFPNIFA